MMARIHFHADNTCSKVLRGEHTEVEALPRSLSVRPSDDEAQTALELVAVDQDTDAAASGRAPPVPYPSTACGCSGIIRSWDIATATRSPVVLEHLTFPR